MSRHKGQPPEMTPERAKQVLRRAGRVSEAPEPPDPSAFIDWEKVPGPEDKAEIHDLSNRQNLLMIGMLKGMTHREASAYARLTYQYARRLVNTPEFREAYNAIMEEMRSDAIREMSSMRALAIRRANDLLLDPTTPHAVVATVVTTVLDRTGLPARVDIAANVQHERIEAKPTEALLRELFASLVSEGLTEEEAAAKVAEQRARV